MEERSQGKFNNWIIGIVSVLVPALVAFLFFFDRKLELGDFVYELPHFHGVLNSLTSIVLIMGLVFIRKGNVEWHKRAMTSAVFMGAVFLLSYVTYHSSVESVRYGDLNHDGVVSDLEAEQAPYRLPYLGLLLSHIGISIFTVPFVLLAFFHALKGNF